jgi:prophage maintenance system killer protein
MSMVWYPSPTDVIKANRIAMRKNRHPHRMRRSVSAIQATIDRIGLSESKGLTYQAARFMRELTVLHAFDGGNHRTAFAIATLFLIENGTSVRTVPPTVSYAFARGLGSKEIEEIQKWIERHMM